MSENVTSSDSSGLDGTLSGAMDVLSARFAESEGGGEHTEPPQKPEPTEDTHTEPAEPVEEHQEEPTEGDEPEPTEEPKEELEEGEGEDEAASATKLPPDDTKIDLGNGRQTTFGELKVLAGKEVAIEQRANEVAQAQNKVIDLARMHVEGLKSQVQFARQAWDELCNVDIPTFRQQATPEQWAAFQQMADQRLNYLRESERRLQGLQQGIQQHEARASQEAITRCARALVDPVTGIPGYTQEKHNSNVAFAESMGLSRDTLDNLTDPAAWKLINMAARYAAGEKAVKATPPKKAAQATKTPALNTRANNTRTGKDDAMKRLQMTGSPTDAMEALMARIGAGDISE